MADTSGDGGRSFFSDRYINRDAPLPFRVDFLAIVGDTLKAVLVLLVSTLAGTQLAFNRAVGQIFQTAFSGLKAVVNTIISAPQITVGTAVRTASQDISVLGIFALPAGIIIAVASVTMVSLIVYLFTGID